MVRNYIEKKIPGYCLTLPVGCGSNYVFLSDLKIRDDKSI